MTEKAKLQSCDPCRSTIGQLNDRLTILEDRVEQILDRLDDTVPEGEREPGIVAELVDMIEEGLKELRAYVSKSRKG